MAMGVALIAAFSVLGIHFCSPTRGADCFSVLFAILTLFCGLMMAALPPVLAENGGKMVGLRAPLSMTAHVKEDTILEPLAAATCHTTDLTIAIPSSYEDFLGFNIAMLKGAVTLSRLNTYSLLVSMRKGSCPDFLRDAP